jgi:hypothetical protein
LRIFISTGILSLISAFVLLPAVPSSAREVTLGVSVFEPGVKPDAVRKYYSDANVELWAAAGVTSWESYIRWAGIEMSPGIWDFTTYDAELETLQKNGLKWVPFLIAGPNYATPKWYRDSTDAKYYKCLEHDMDSGVQSIFNPAWRARVDEFVRRFAGRYRDGGGIESVLLGITGDYGEAIYPVEDVGHWTGNYHQHPGYWAGDPYARESFRKWLAAKYGDAASLDRAWGANFSSIQDIEPFLPEKRPSDAAWLDMLTWYRESIEGWADFWIATARKYFPDTRIYLCTGGDGNPKHGSRFGRQVKIAAKYGAGVRITNEGSDYANNFTLTRWVASAGKFYGTYYGFEPASGVTPPAVVRRVYNVTASGAGQLFEYSGNVVQAAAWKGNYPEWVKEFATVKSIVPVAAFIPETSLALNPDRWGDFYAAMRALRELGDFDFVDEQMAADGALDRYRIVYFPDGAVVDDAAGAALDKWVRAGGLLIGRDLEKVRLLSGSPLLSGFNGKSKKTDSLKKIVQPYGDGFVASHSLDIASLSFMNKTFRIQEQMFSKACMIDGKYPCLPEADGAGDGVFTTLTPDGLLMLNTTDAPYEKEIKLNRESLASLGVTGPVPDAITVRLEPQSMKLVRFH